MVMIAAAVIGLATLHADANTQQVIEYGLHEPGRFAVNLRNKTLSPRWPRGLGGGPNLVYD